jgi:hypothetical protein
MNFSSSDDAVSQSNPRRAFQFPPPSRAERAPEPHDIPDSATDRYGFDVLNLTDDFNVHNSILGSAR